MKREWTIVAFDGVLNCEDYQQKPGTNKDAISDCWQLLGYSESYFG
jgi:hypothetical protein